MDATLTIKANEPEGWAKAFEVVHGERHIAWFRFHDSAAHFIAETSGSAV